MIRSWRGCFGNWFFFYRIGDQLGPRLDAQLLEYIVQVGLYGRLRDVEPVGDLLVPEARARKRDYLFLPVGECVDCFAAQHVYAVEDAFEGLFIYPHIPVRNGPYGLFHKLAVGVPEKYPAA